MNVTLADPRRRTLAVLAGTALVFILLAALALWRQAAELAPPRGGDAFLPELADHEREAARIHFASKKGSFDVVFRPNHAGASAWVIPQKGDYPAAFPEVNKTLLNLANLKAIEPKTAQPEWFRYVDLDAPPKGAGTEITVKDEKGRTLASLIVGKSEEIGDAGGATGLFVRRPGENQSWLVRSESGFQTDVNGWLDKTALDLDPTRIQSTIVTAADGSSYELVRDAKTDAHFKLAAMPAGRTLSNEGAPDSPADALSGFSFEDAKPAGRVDFSHAAHIRTRTFDGLQIDAAVAKIGTEYWVSLEAANVGNSPSVAKEARDINARAAGWAYKLADYKGAQFTTPLESLLAPKGGAKPAATPVPEQ
ncbi:MAG: DUF4340 domain-containing protein [Alphaproteobacteria bacterium]|nr:DUF4340 domain-containing protein [Alphaproteobacteria bacterium]MBV9693221.1 DUF4340 domain-containing protein [Alphaproteobacteria bacterium]